MGPNRLVFTLLIFGVYPRMTKLDTLSPLIIQYTMAIKKAIDEIRKCIVSRQVNNTFNTHNRPSTIFVYNLPINLLVLVYQKRKAS